MAQFNIENDINSLLHMDVPLNRAPKPRLQKKPLDSSVVSNGSFNVSTNVSINKTPKANVSANVSTTSFMKTPSKSPKKTPGKSKRTPKKAKTPKTPNGGDRFIPNRTTTQFDLGHYKLVQDNDENDANLSPSKAEQQKVMRNTLHGFDFKNTRIISYSTKAPPAPEGFQSELRVLYSHGQTPASNKKANRHIPQGPERILDAPDIKDDYYLNILDWSSTNIVAISLADSIYLWKAQTGDIKFLMTLDGTDPEAYVSSVSWIEDGTHLAVGTYTGAVELWDIERGRRVRVMAGHSARVGALSWNQHVCSSGDRAGQIHHHDVRSANHLVGTLAGHTQEVCGLKWSADGRYLASGGNDNIVNIWCSAVGECFTDTTPLYTFNQHMAAIKALSWCPWQPSILASGGGSTDRCIRLWNCNTGACLNTTDTKSQVCSILWSKEYKELVSGHGYVNNQLSLWKYPAMTKISDLTGHTARVLNLSMSPDGNVVASAGADETLRFWKCFATDPKKAKNDKKSKVESGNVILRQSIR